MQLDCADFHNKSNIHRQRILRNRKIWEASPHANETLQVKSYAIALGWAVRSILQKIIYKHYTTAYCNWYDIWILKIGKQTLTATYRSQIRLPQLLQIVGSNIVKWFVYWERFHVYFRCSSFLGDENNQLARTVKNNGWIEKKTS